LDVLRSSLHNCIAIGDVENDYQLLDACEFGVAVAWGSKTLREVADEVLLGNGTAAVDAFIRRVIVRGAEVLATMYGQPGEVSEWESLRVNPPTQPRAADP
jgi:3-deoxy-D-manno-octulosonate 8-phosphate phosphatase KdsC-like HAD superfamily phosphatase